MCECHCLIWEGLFHYRMINTVHAQSAKPPLLKFGLEGLDTLKDICNSY